MNDFLTWSLLATFAGASAATAIITQFVKDALSKIPTQIVSYVIALIVLLIATAATGGAAYYKRQGRIALYMYMMNPWPLRSGVFFIRFDKVVQFTFVYNNMILIYCGQ